MYHLIIKIHWKMKLQITITIPVPCIRLTMAGKLQEWDISISRQNLWPSHYSWGYYPERPIIKILKWHYTPAKLIEKNKAQIFCATNSMMWSLEASLKRWSMTLSKWECKRTRELHITCRKSRRRTWISCFTTLTTRQEMRRRLHLNNKIAL